MSYIDSKNIYRIASRIIQRCGTNDPDKIARELGIEVTDVDYFQNLLGFYSYRWRKRFIILNNRLSENHRQMILCHELGHDALHRACIKGLIIKEFEIFHMSDPREYEANAYASHILIDTNDFLELARNGYDIYQIARYIKTEVNMVLIKSNELNSLGFNLRLPQTPQGDFLKNLKADSGQII